MLHKQILSPLIDKSTLYKEKRHNSPLRHQNDVRKQNILHMASILKERRPPSRLLKSKHSRRSTYRSSLTDNLFSNMIPETHLPPEEFPRAESPTRNMLLINSFLPNYTIEKSLVFWPDTFASTQYVWSSQSRSSDRHGRSVIKQTSSESPAKHRNMNSDKPFPVVRKTSLKALDSSKHTNQVPNKNCECTVNSQNSNETLKTAAKPHTSRGFNIKVNMYKLGTAKKDFKTETPQIRNRRLMEAKLRKSEVIDEDWNMLSAW